MKRTSRLPENLHYLQPVRKQLVALAPEEINEDTDLSILRKAVRKRAKGLSMEELDRVLMDDADELEKWISAANGANDYMSFILPLLRSGEPEILLSKSPS